VKAFLERLPRLAWRRSGAPLRFLGHAPEELPVSESSARRVRVPTVLQLEAVECGAAALAMVLASYGRRVPLEELRARCGVSRDGSKASNVVRAARGYGLNAKGFKADPAGLRRMSMPTIIHWNFNHFVVLEGFGRNGQVYLNDPAYGARVVTAEELDQSFTGVVLTLQRGPEFQPGGEGSSLFAMLRRRMTTANTAIAFVVVAGLALVLPGLVVPTFSRVFVDEILVKGMIEWQMSLLVAMGATALTLGALTWLQQLYLLRLETKLALVTSARFFWHVLHLPMQFFAQRFAGEIASRVAINDRVAQLLSGDLATTALAVVVIAFYAALMLRYDILLTAVVVGMTVVNFVVLRIVNRSRDDMMLRVMQDRGKALSTAMGGLTNIETLKATGSESDFFSRWAGYYTKVVNTKQRLGEQVFVVSALPQLLTAISVAAILGIGGLMVMRGEMTMGMLIAFQGLTLAFVSPVNQLFGLADSLEEAKADMERLDDVLRANVQSTAAESDDLPDDVPARFNGRLELRDVSFGYSPLEPPLVENFNLVLEPGSRVALVGGSGSGKSTIARLVSGLYEPWTGSILFDGFSRTTAPRQTMLNSLAVVDQDIFLFEGTVRDNLTLWDSTVPDADVVQAARDACIDDDISARPAGYSSHVEEGGRNFSGGQRQRIEIARALVKNPSILVLDEATSALDPTTEQIIDDNLRRRGCTCLIVAHRLSTIRDCDEIIVLRHGHVIQRGTHEELKDRPGLYRELIAME
jgi:NHLM bacteriocin system ABC transporter peptidase/ATP-binding protein